MLCGAGRRARQPCAMPSYGCMTVPLDTLSTSDAIWRPVIELKQAGIPSLASACLCSRRHERSASMKNHRPAFASGTKIPAATPRRGPARRSREPRALTNHRLITEGVAQAQALSLSGFEPERQFRELYDIGELLGVCTACSRTGQSLRAFDSTKLHCHVPCALVAGSGAEGEVFLASHRRTGEKCVTSLVYERVVRSNRRHTELQFSLLSSWPRVLP